MTAAKTGRHEAPAQPQKPGFWQIYGVTVAVTLVVIGLIRLPLADPGRL